VSRALELASGCDSGAPNRAARGSVNIVLPAGSQTDRELEGSGHAGLWPLTTTAGSRGAGVLEDDRVRSGGDVALKRAAVATFADTLGRQDRGVRKATTDTPTRARYRNDVSPASAQANTETLRPVAGAKVKTDKVDAKARAMFYAVGLLPEIRQPVPETGRQQHPAAQRAFQATRDTRLESHIRVR